MRMAVRGIQGGRPADRFHGVAVEVEQAESRLRGPGMDPSRGYAIYKAGEHRVSITWSDAGLQVHLDGKLLVEEGAGGSKH